MSLNSSRMKYRRRTNGFKSSIDLNLFPARIKIVKLGQPSRFSKPELRRLSLR